MGFDPVVSLLKLRGVSYSFTQQKVGNLRNPICLFVLIAMPE